MTAEQIKAEILDLLAKMVYRNLDYAVDQVLKILKDQTGMPFVRVSAWPENREVIPAHFVIISSPTDVEVSMVRFNS